MNVSKGVEKLNESLVDTADEGISLACSSDKNSVPNTTADVVMITESAMEGKNTCNDSPGKFEEIDDIMSLHVVELSKIERVGVISVLEDCIDQLYILGKTKRNTIGSTDLQYRSLKERATLEGILQKIVEELKLEKSFKTLVKVSELEIQQQNEETALIRMEEENVKEINKLHNILERDLRQGTDKINRQRDTIAWLKNLEGEIKRWKEKYYAELEDRETKLQQLQAERELKYNELQELSLMYEERKKQIDAYLAHKETQAARAAYETYLFRMATIIQAWWRGTMVRRGLGPYKKSKKDKDKKGKSKVSKGGAKKTA